MWQTTHWFQFCSSACSGTCEYPWFIWHFQASGVNSYIIFNCRVVLICHRHIFPVQHVFSHLNRHPLSIDIKYPLVPLMSIAYNDNLWSPRGEGRRGSPQLPASSALRHSHSERPSTKTPRRLSSPRLHSTWSEGWSGIRLVSVRWPVEPPCVEFECPRMPNKPKRMAENRYRFCDAKHIETHNIEYSAICSTSEKHGHCCFSLFFSPLTLSLHGWFARPFCIQTNQGYSRCSQRGLQQITRQTYLVAG